VTDSPAIDGKRSVDVQPVSGKVSGVFAALVFFFRWTRLPTAIAVTTIKRAHRRMTVLKRREVSWVLFFVRRLGPIDFIVGLLERERHDVRSEFEKDLKATPRYWGLFWVCGHRSGD
jgi:hypothetical protein